MHKHAKTVVWLLSNIQILPVLLGCTASIIGCYQLCVDEKPCEESEPTEEVGTAINSSAVQVESNCAGKAEVYCITVHLKDGAKLKPFLASGPLAGGTQACRGWSNVFAEKSVKEFSLLNVTYDGYNLQNAKVIVSGSFHNDLGKPAYPMKVKEGGWIATYGYECNVGVGSLRILSVRNSQGRAFIEPFDLAKFNASTSAPEAIVGLDPSVYKDATSNRGRNFVGASNPYNGGYGTLIFVVAKEGPGLGITSTTAVNILKSKGCPDAQILQLDGSTVAQVSKNNNGTWSHLIQDSRQMPQVFGIFAP